MNDKLTPKMIRKAVKILEKHKVTKPYYIDVEKPSEVYDLLSNYNKNKKTIDKITLKKGGNMENKELRINVLTDRIEEDRYRFITFQHNLKPSDPQWFYIQGKISILTDLLYFYYSETSE